MKKLFTDLGYLLILVVYPLFIVGFGLTAVLSIISHYFNYKLLNGSVFIQDYCIGVFMGLAQLIISYDLIVAGYDIGGYALFFAPTLIMGIFFALILYNDW